MVAITQDQGLYGVTELAVRVFRTGLRQLVERALRLPPRSGIRWDTLHVHHVSGHLEVEWQARNVHPWDRVLSHERQVESFGNQTFIDTEHAVTRLFNMLPEVDSVTVRVMAPAVTERPIMTGTVHRRDLITARSGTSVRMRLWRWGLRYQEDQDNVSA